MKALWRSALAVTAVLVIGSATAHAAPPADPEARRTWAAERREKMRQMDPEERAALRAERRARHNKDLENRPPRPMEIRAPLPLPVAVANPGDLRAVGTPAGDTCPRDKTCTLELKPAAGEVVLVTAVWSADKIQCDDITSSTPAGGQPIAPQWRCERSFVASGMGAGYTAITIAK